MSGVVTSESVRWPGLAWQTTVLEHPATRASRFPMMEYHIRKLESIAHLRSVCQHVDYGSGKEVHAI